MAYFAWMMRRERSRVGLSVIVLILSATQVVTAQDPQFSQFYAAPLYLNPAFAGSTGQARAGVNYRNQWPAITSNFTTINAYFDYFILDKKSAVGGYLYRDREGLAGLSSIQLALQYAYELTITDGLAFRPGAQVSFYNRDLNFDKLTFGDQIDPATGDIISPVTAEQFDTGFNKFFVDLSLGGLFYSRRAWLGVSAFHLNTPNQSILDEESPLPIKLSVHGGLKFFMKPGVVGSGIYARNAERSVGPAIQYRRQGDFSQLDVGTYLTLEPMVLGLWYRGIPFKSLNGFVNNESIVLLLGFMKLGDKDQLNIGYSFDYTISKLGAGSGGSHEFSLVYTWPMRNPRKPPPDKMVIPCPDF
jgi:type IX secretion system PorP/SprF family membrane protein